MSVRTYVGSVIVCDPQGLDLKNSNLSLKATDLFGERLFLFHQDRDKIGYYIYGEKSNNLELCRWFDENEEFRLQLLPHAIQNTIIMFSGKYCAEIDKLKKIFGSENVNVRFMLIGEYY